MTGKIWLIVEDRNDGEIIKKIFIQHKIASEVQVQQPSSGGINRLAQELEEIIGLIRKQKSTDDCVVVIHDYDIKTIPHPRDRGDHKLIAKICEKNRDITVELVAHDELEAWLLADSGVCRWLGTKPQPSDELRKPSEKLYKLIEDKINAHFGGRYRDQLVKKIAGDGDKHSLSMRKALKVLNKLDCVKA